MINRRSIGVSLVCGSLLLSAWVASAQKQTMAVSSIKATAAVREQMTRAGKASSLNRVVQSFDGQFIDSINATRKFDIVGRSDLKDILKEQDLAGSGNVDVLDKNTAQAGKLAGAKYLIVTVLDDFEDSIEKMAFGTLNQVGIKRKIRISAVAKIYDSSTGKLLESVSIQTMQKDSRSDSTALAKDAELTDELLLTTVREVAGKVATRVADVIFPAKVMAKDDKEITINRGDGTGIAEGQIWNVYAVGEELIDEDTKESLGRKETLIGKAKVTTVNPKTSTAELLEDNGVVKGAILRLPKVK